MSPEKRLIHYRCAFIARGNCGADAETYAHAMLADERPISLAIVPPVEDSPRIEWRHGPAAVSVCRLSTRALVMWGDVHRTPAGWVARCDVEQIDGAYQDLETATKAVEKALRARLATLTGAT